MEIDVKTLLFKRKFSHLKAKTFISKEFTKIFPFKLEGEMSPENRKKGASLIRKVRSLDGKAIKQMEKALKKW